ncbi:hypothetical protein DV711_02565 [Motiliproteus coralliicola]|uniref:Surface antigen domain-containing protein n=2 Tax=Motiliproteus coralliicola TaxID=2283196 RepID=A0A369WSF6_9GAMM|nr:hypothetical protein DV711_02565 [Motiliproteus coralliicola]
MKHYALMFSLVALTATATVAQASNLLFLSNSVLKDLDPQDADSLIAEMQTTLEQAQDFEIRHWQSAYSDLKVRIQPLITYQSNQQQCRAVRIRLTQPMGKDERYQFDYCRNVERWDISYTPAGSFDENDWQLLQRTVQRALNENNNGQPSSWTNHNSKHSGVVVPSTSKMNGGERCRQTAITIFDSHGKSSNGSYLFCLQEDGQWQRRL